MRSVDITLPRVTTTSLLLSSVTEWLEDKSVWLKGALWLLSVQVMVGTGTPVEVQEMLTLPSSVTTTSPPIILFVLASAAGTVHDEVLNCAGTLHYLIQSQGTQLHLELVVLNLVLGSPHTARDHSQ